LRPIIALPPYYRFEISAERFRFSVASDALVAALAHETGTDKLFDYDVGYSEGDTSGWAVEVYRAGRRSEHLGNLRPVGGVAEPTPNCTGACTLSYGEGTKEDPDRCVVCDALFLRDQIVPIGYA